MPIVVLYILGWWGGFALLCIFLTTNSAPTEAQLEWGVEEPTTTSKIEVKIARESVDRNADLVTYNYAWFNNGQPIPERTAKVLDPKDYKKGDVVSVEVTPDDGTMGSTSCILPWRQCAGEIKSSIEVTVVNSPPKARVKLLTDDEEGITARMDIEVDLLGIDNDSDEVTFTTGWYKVGEDPLVAILEESKAKAEEAEEEWDEELALEEALAAVEYEYTGAVLPSSATRRDDTWWIRVIPSDGELEGEMKYLYVTIE